MKVSIGDINKLIMILVNLLYLIVVNLVDVMVVLVMDLIKVWEELLGILKY